MANKFRAGERGAPPQTRWDALPSKRERVEQADDEIVQAAREFGFGDAEQFRICAAPTTHSELGGQLENEKISMSVRLTTHGKGDVIIVDPGRKLTLCDGTNALRQKMRELVEGGSRRILLNMAGVACIDASGIGELAAAYTAVTSAGGEMKLLNLTKRVHDLLKITRLNTVFETFEDECSHSSRGQRLRWGRGPPGAQLPRQQDKTLAPLATRSPKEIDLHVSCGRSPANRCQSTPSYDDFFQISVLPNRPLLLRTTSASLVGSFGLDVSFKQERGRHCRLGNVLPDFRLMERTGGGPA